MSSEATRVAMNQEASTALVPKLRFPEFRRAEEWKIVPLSDLVRCLDAGVSVTSGDRPATEYEIGILKTSSVTNGIFEPLENKVVFDEGEKERVKEPVQSGTIIISRMNTPALVGANAYVERSLQNVFLPDRLWAAKPKQGVSMRFVASILGSARSRAALSKIAKGSSGSMKNISKVDVLAFRIQTPSPAEQEKIAACLSSLDELIAAQAQKVEALKTNKKGLMQQLFPREKETQPRLRFPEFQDAGEWEVKRVDEHGTVLAGKALAVNAPGPLRPYLRTKNVLDGLIDLSDVLTMPMTDAEFSRFEILDGDVLLNEGQSLELVGRASIYRGEFRDRCAMQNQLLRFRAFPATCEEFAAQYFRKCQKDGTFANVATKTTSVAHLGSSRFSALELAWPSLPEQQRIASCLSSLDALITAETQKLEALKIHKKGLMQQLFPSLEGETP
jgi:restriction endonuclease S subunit